MRLHQINPPEGSRRGPKRLGRGDASGHGGTSTRGHKGHKSRSGFSLGFNFEGGQMPLARRLPKRGFTHLPARPADTVNLRVLEARCSDGDVVSPETLAEQGIVRSGVPVKILGAGSLSKKLEVHAHRFSEKARKEIEKAGGKAVVVSADGKSRG